MGDVDPVDLYIRNQVAHHQKVSFKDEYRTMLTEAGIPLDEQYMWDQSEAMSPLWGSGFLDTPTPGSSLADARACTRV